ncbi:hypothetical protein TYRP_019208 [Tyrophagus putrescentiae]|nr:hypothetical protein TYRP_019208 [Tyrophagus putrescentiae]
MSESDSQTVWPDFTDHQRPTMRVSRAGPSTWAQVVGQVVSGEPPAKRRGLATLEHLKLPLPRVPRAKRAASKVNQKP